ncbi:MAG: hypothetical protein SV186_00805 [Candidatus Nanohaloarchaea archaeon]|nr:hypothetical protein [Candidatus Nanohaloarchaea archaeon]
MQIERIDEEDFFSGLNERIADLAFEIEETAKKIKENPDSSTYHIDNFSYPMKVMRQLQRLRDKARAFKENEDEEVVYIQKEAEGEKPKYYYLPKSDYDKSKLSEIVKKMEKREDTETDLGYIS